MASERIDGRALSDLWTGAMVFAPHLAGCTCAGGFHVPLDPRAVEEDLLDFLAYRYKSEKLDRLCDFVTKRIQNRETDFGRWLENLDAAPLESADRDRIVNDLRTTLDSMNGARAGKSGFVCY